MKDAPAKVVKDHQSPGHIQPKNGEGLTGAGQTDAAEGANRHAKKATGEFEQQNGDGNGVARTNPPIVASVEVGSSAERSEMGSNE